MRSTISLIALIVVISTVAAFHDATNQTLINESFDAFLERYANVTIQHSNKNGALNLNRTVYFTRTFLTGTQVVNETRFYGLNDVERFGNVNVTKTGKYSFNVKGQIVLAAPKVEGSVYLFKGQPIGNVSFHSISSSDIPFAFVSNFNTRWNQVTFETFNYNESAPIFPITMDCSDKFLEECGKIKVDVMNAIRLYSSDLVLLIRQLLSETPVKH